VEVTGIGVCVINGPTWRGWFIFEKP